MEPRRRCGDRSIVDDAATARLLRLHDAKGGRHTVEHARQVHVDDGAPVCQVELIHRHGRRADAGIVEQQVDTAPLGDDRIKQGGDRFGVGHVRRNDEAGRAGGIGVLCRLHERGLATAGVGNAPAIVG